MQSALLDSETIQSLYAKIKQLVDRVVRAQQNIKELETTIETWSTLPLFERRDGKKENLLNIDDRTERIQRRYEQIEQTSKSIASLLEENYKLFFNIPLIEPGTVIIIN